MPILTRRMNFEGTDFCNLDFNNFNPADMLPQDDFAPERIPARYNLDLKHLCWYAFRISFVFLIFVSLIGFIFDPTPIASIYNYFIKLPVETCDLNCKFDEENKEIKVMHTKLNFLNEELANIRVALENVKTLETSSHNSVDIEKKIQEALNVYDADKLGLIDYALESAGGSIVDTPLTTPYPSKTTYDIMGVFGVHSSSNPRLMIQPGNLPGQCFAFHGHKGRIQIKLAQTVQITSVTMEYAHPSLVTDVTSCPKDFKVYGLSSADGQFKMDLGLFTYRLSGPTLQTFDVDNQHKGRYDYIELHVLNNYGHTDYTCIYRFRVHSNIVS